MEIVPLERSISAVPEILAASKLPLRIFTEQSRALMFFTVILPLLRCRSIVSRAIISISDFKLPLARRQVKLPCQEEGRYISICVLLFHYQVQFSCCE
jgi:hypothetical protein